MITRLLSAIVLGPAFVLLALAAHGGPFPLDRLVAPALHHDSVGLQIFNDLAGAPVWGVLVLAAVGVLWLRGSRHAALLLLIAELTTEGLTFIAKSLVDRRETITGQTVDDIERLAVPGFFPSGHVMRAVVTLGVLVALLAWRRPRWRLPSVTAVVAFVLVLGLARIVAGEHWLSDVVGAYLLGGIWLDVLLTFGWRPLAGVARSRGGLGDG